MTDSDDSSTLIPRKRPAQRRAEKTVDTILDAAAQILDRLGFDGYNTNAIASRAGVSIGSLYQYFPTKEAITAALIERGRRQVLDSIAEYANLEDWRGALQHVVVVAAEHQLSRPKLAKLLDSEEDRLSISVRDEHVAKAVRTLISKIVATPATAIGMESEAAAADVMLMIQSLTDGASKRDDTNIHGLQARIARAVFGYFNSTPPSSS